MVHFFDEICDLPLQTQGKLVQAIQDQSFYKIGSNKKINVDVESSQQVIII